MSRQPSRLRGLETKAKPNILGIPAEIRLYIYEYIYSATSTAKDYDRYASCVNHVTDNCVLNSSCDEFRGYAAVLLTCRTFYHEAADLLYKPITHPSYLREPQLVVWDDAICLDRFPRLFCHKHLEYRHGTAGIFRRINTLRVEILGTLEPELGCGQWPLMADGVSHLPPFGFDAKNQALDNVRWLAEQMKQCAELNFLSITVGWYDDDFDKEPTLDESALLIKPFKALRNVKQLELHLGTEVESAVDDGWLGGLVREWEVLNDYKRRMGQILGSNALITENPIPLADWLDLKRTVKRVMAFAPQVAAHIHLNKAALAVADQNATAFQQALTGLIKAWKDDGKKRKELDLRITKLLDIPEGKGPEDDPEGMEYRDA